MALSRQCMRYFFESRLKTFSLPIVSSPCFSWSNRTFAQIKKREAKKARKAAQEIRELQMAKDPSGLLAKTLASQEQFYAEQGQLEDSVINKEGQEIEKENLVDMTSTETTETTTTQGFKYNYDPMAGQDLI
ncbi:hypothetical protein RFI_23903 [Reticulomyxa filosa]|uniref:Uncharacterized protein n=1 Tax=Reticulomyxa filosa TaxID=46433 RepID=X6MJ61_RETFI|nr:hypothetical protein RFI_23903 [Reticulomyxa filosa]|eukprot:ETO13467.1 hypothetical protein RFI_23903 [Reticulomyxa filosa]